MQHCKCPLLEGQYHPDNPVFVSVGKREVKTETWHINPEYLKSVEAELKITRQQRDDWIWAYGVLTGVLKGLPGWDTAKEFTNFGQGLFQLEGVSLAKEARRAIENQRALTESAKKGKFEMVASYSDGRHCVYETEEAIDALLLVKEHIEKGECDYVRIMRRRELTQ